MSKSLLAEGGFRSYQISSGKLRRYFSWQTFVDSFRILQAFFQALSILRKEKPDVLFSKGGYVAVPVAYAAYILKIPVITHESDLIPGLATKLIAKVSRKVCVSFPETVKYFTTKAVLTGNPVRNEILQGSAVEAYRLTGFSDTLATVLIMGGSLGAKSINDAVLAILPKLLKTAQVMHITGAGHKLPYKASGYFQREFVLQDLKHLYQIADLVLARAGANSIAELASLGKACLFIPLGPPASRGEQLANAEALQTAGAAVVLPQTELTPDRLLTEIQNLLGDERKCVELGARIQAFARPGASQLIVKLIQELGERRRETEHT